MWIIFCNLKTYNKKSPKHSWIWNIYCWYNRHKSLHVDQPKMVIYLRALLYLAYHNYQQEKKEIFFAICLSEGALQINTKHGFDVFKLHKHIIEIINCFVEHLTNYPRRNCIVVITILHMLDECESFCYSKKQNVYLFMS